MPFANPCVIQIIRGDCKNIRNIHIIYPVLELFYPEKEIFHILNSRNVGNSSGRAGHSHRHPSAEKSADLSGLCLHLESLEIVCNSKEIDIRRQFVCGMPPIGICKRSELL